MVHSASPSSSPQPSPAYEISVAVKFLCKYLEGCSDQEHEQFKSTATNLLVEKFQGHWFELDPCRGSAYRCLRSNPGKMDPVLLAVEKTCNLRLQGRIPENFSLWIDPGDVSCRLGEHGSVWSVLGSSSTTTASPDAASQSPNMRAYSPPSSPPRSRNMSRSSNITFVPYSPSQSQLRSPSTSPTFTSPSNTTANITNPFSRSRYSSQNDSALSIGYSEDLSPARNRIVFIDPSSVSSSHLLLQA